MRFFPAEWPNWARTTTKCQLFGSYCALCARPGQQGIDLCASCQGLFRLIMHTGLKGNRTLLCMGCGIPQDLPPLNRSRIGDASDACEAEGNFLTAPCASSPIDDFCADCIGKQGQLLRHIVAPYRYAFPIDAMLKRLKYRQDRQLARVFGALLGRHVLQRRKADLPQILLPMPLHASRLRERGFNQAQDIARWCGQELGISVQPHWVTRIAETGSLAGLSRAERQHQILGAFRADEALAGRHVAIVDDVLTTGASSRELAREIYDSGAESVELWVLARTSSTRVGG